MEIYFTSFLSETLDGFIEVANFSSIAHFSHENCTYVCLCMLKFTPKARESLQRFSEAKCTFHSASSSKQSRSSSSQPVGVPLEFRRIWPMIIREHISTGGVSGRKTSFRFFAACLSRAIDEAPGFALVLCTRIGPGCVLVLCRKAVRDRAAKTRSLPNSLAERGKQAKCNQLVMERAFSRLVFVEPFLSLSVIPRASRA